MLWTAPERSLRSALAQGVWVGRGKPVGTATDDHGAEYDVFVFVEHHTWRLVDLGWP